MHNVPHDTPTPIRLLIYTTLDESVGSWEPAVWISRFKWIDHDQPLNELLPDRLKHYVRYYITKDEVLCKYLAKGKYKITLSCTLRVPGNSELTFPLNEDPRVETLGDLASERYPSGPITIEAHLVLSMSPRRQYSPRAGKDPEDQICTMSYRPHLEWYRLGHVPVLEDDWETLSVERADRNRSGAAYTNPLLASLNPRTARIKPKLSRIHAYDFEDFVIGDLGESKRWNELKFEGNNWQWLGPFSHPKLAWGSVYTKYTFERMFRKYVAAKEKEDSLDNGLPFLPTFCYNTFRAEDYDLGLETWPRKGIDVAVRCVNHYGFDEGLEEVEFPRDIRFVVLESDTVETVCEQVSEQINTEGLRDGVVVNSNQLFASEHLGKWEMKLWVMAQGMRKMFRYTQVDLSQFLDPSEYTRDNDKRLYLEAHINPKIESASIQTD